VSVNFQEKVMLNILLKFTKLKLRVLFFNNSGEEFRFWIDFYALKKLRNI